MKSGSEAWGTRNVSMLSDSSKCVFRSVWASRSTVIRTRCTNSDDRPGEVNTRGVQKSTVPGLSSEFVHLVRMTVDLDAQTDLRTHFDESESIETFLVPQDALPDFIRRAEAEGCGVDTKLYMWAITRGGFLA